MKETLNLLPTEVKARGVGKRSLFYYIMLGIAVYSIVILGFWAFSILEAGKINSEIDRLNRQKADLQQKIIPLPVAAVSLPVDKEILEAIEQTPKWSAIISEISVIVPEDVWLSSIESREEKGVKQMEIKGFSKSQLGVASFISALEASRYFHDVEIMFSQKGEKDISFELKTRLRWT